MPSLVENNAHLATKTARRVARLHSAVGWVNTQCVYIYIYFITDLLLYIMNMDLYKSKKSILL